MQHGAISRSQEWHAVWSCKPQERKSVHARLLMLARLVTMTAAAMELLQTCVHIECMYLILKKTHFE